MSTTPQKTVERRDSVTICFAGDSGDGMQLTGTQFTNTSALAGNDLATFPDFPAEIRAPAGTRAGVSGFQVQIASHDIFTPGDEPEVLVAMNPAALVANLSKLRPHGTVILNIDKFEDRDLEKADLASDPRSDGTLTDYQVIEVKLTSLTKEAVKGTGLNAKESDRCKNFFALGMAYWMYNRDTSHTRDWIERKFKDPYRAANLAALEAGWNYALTMELLERSFEVPAAQLPAGTYRNVTGNQALAMGLAAAAVKSGLRLFYGSYPITPASDILHNLAQYKHYDVTTFQAEDEIAAACAAIGASYGGALGVTATSGPGLALKGEALGLAVMTELPLVVVDVQRGGPSTGLPTKTEQSDLLMAMYGRNGEAPMPIVAAATPADCFDAAITAARFALHAMVPVMLLTDGYLANGSEPWLLPDVDSIEAIPNRKITENNNPGGQLLPYKRDPETLARPWAVPGTPGLEHRIGGLEKQDQTGNVSYDPRNHHFMTETRQAKVDALQALIPPVEPLGASSGLLVLSWGSTYGAVRQATLSCLAEGRKVAHLHLRHLNPFAANLPEVLARYERVLVPEMNMGQLAKLIRERFLIDVIPLNKVHGQPFKVSEIKSAILDQLAQEGSKHA
ncbi:MAG: 2-oxoacid:acceptor oxidoreductase subunit alpha [Alphaproteobacteria bacterium]|nr:2-oxoacid:acceptor oxidoreductase subunit alpha [Alphaproteobacteria bacterium]MCB9794419.1 2-oxoacid:acceptor oxidoreductase subunit alpha [Alphaproteobacteria bacterium]